MGLFGESRAEREAREERTLLAIFKSIEEAPKTSDPKGKDPKGKDNVADVKNALPLVSQATKPINPEPETLARQATAEDLAIYLAKKGLITLSDWENHKTKNQLS